MEGINPNTPTNAVPEKLEQSGGDTPASFDDLDSVMGYDGVPSKHDGEELEKGDSNEKESSKKSSKESRKEKSKEVTEDSEDAEELPDDKAASKDDKADKKKEDKKPEFKQSKDKDKIIKVKNGESTVELQPDSVIEVLVNGKKESVTMRDLKNEFAGKTDWARKYQEMDKEKKDFQKEAQKFKSEKETLDGTWKEFFRLSSQEKNPIAAVNMLGELSGQDMVKFWKEFRSSLEPVIEERLKLSPEERKIADLQDELNLRDNLETRKNSAAKTQQERQQYISKIDAQREEAGLSKDEFVKLHEELKSSGLLKADQLTPELVLNYHKELGARQSLQNVLSEVNSKMQGPELNAAVNDLRQVWIDNPGFGVEEIRQIAVEVWGDKAAVNLSKKLSRANPTKNYKPEISNQGDPLTFDDI